MRFRPVRSKVRYRAPNGLHFANYTLCHHVSDQTTFCSLLALTAFADRSTREDEPMILRTMNDISNTIKLIAAPKTEDDQPDGRLDLSTPTPTVSCDRRNPVEKPVEEKPPDAGCSVM